MHSSCSAASIGAANNPGTSWNELNGLKKKKHVTFSDRISVVLIPSRAEYEALHLTNKLWWSHDEFVETKQGAETELVGALSLESSISSMEALYLLYQPRCKQGLLIIHILVASVEPKFRAHLYHIISKAHVKNGLENRLLIHQACSVEDMFDKLNICVEYNAVFIDRDLICHVRDERVNLVEEVRRRHTETCVVVVQEHGRADMRGTADCYWPLEAATGFHREWREVLIISEAYRSRPSPSPSEGDAAVLGDEAKDAGDAYPCDELVVDEFSGIPRTLAALAGYSDYPCLVLDRCPPFVIVDCNPLWSDIFGYAASECVGREVTLIRGDKTDPKKLANLKIAIQNGIRYSTFLINYDAGGAEFIGYIRGVPLVSQVPGETHYVCVFEKVDRCVISV